MLSRLGIGLRGWGLVRCPSRDLVGVSFLGEEKGYKELLPEC